MDSKLSRAAVEPFRLFFPLGIIASVIGVLMWPAFFHGWLKFYPLEAHARMMVLGFGGCFITGFLGTAGPRLLGSRHWSIKEFLLLLVLAMAAMILLAFDKVVAADRVAGVWLLCVLASLVSRLLFGREDVPPPGVPLAALGLAGAGISGILLSFPAALGSDYSVVLFLRLLYFQGLLWLPILGVAPYLLPRFFGRKSPHSFEDSGTIPPGWMRPFVESSIAGVLLIGSFALEAWGYGRVGMILRVVVVTVHLARSVPGLISFSKVNALGLSLRWVLPCSVAGWLLGVFFPHLRVGTLHLMFIGGAGLLMIAVATRVFCGHNNRHDLLATPMRWFHLVWGLTVFAAATRLTSDFVAKVRITHFTYAAVLWVLILAFWWWKLNRDLRKPIFEEGVIKSKCPRRIRAAARKKEAAASAQN